MEASWHYQASRPAAVDVAQTLAVSGRIPLTSTARLSAADAQAEPFPAEPMSPNATATAMAMAASATVLYLAYGSNMSAETVLGRRGIKPLSQVNVSVPSLRLVFDVSGLPYMEPQVANAAIRKVPKPPVLVPTRPLPSPPNLGHAGGREWTLGLMGVVYEVTAADYLTIIKTEGGGSIYKQVLVPCFPLVPAGWPPVFPRPFLARTLFAPQVPADIGDDGPKMPRWFARMLLPHARPDPEHAQASARYLKLLMDGAAEHGLPADYQAYLAALQPYTITSRRQELGRAVFAGFWALVFAAIFQLIIWLADHETGNIPAWLAGTVMFLRNLMWMLYDDGAIKVFGDGERTEVKDEGPDRALFDEKRALAVTCTTADEGLKTSWRFW